MYKAVNAASMKCCRFVCIDEMMMMMMWLTGEVEGERQEADTWPQGR